MHPVLAYLCGCDKREHLDAMQEVQRSNPPQDICVPSLQKGPGVALYQSRETRS